MNNAVFEIVDNRLVSTTKAGETVPDDEPVFILRGRDLKALSTIRSYQSTFSPMNDSWKTTQKVLNDFSEFREQNPKKMTEPEDLY